MHYSSSLFNSNEKVKNTRCKDSNSSPSCDSVTITTERPENSENNVSAQNLHTYLCLLCKLSSLSPLDYPFKYVSMLVYKVATMRKQRFNNYANYV